MIRDRARCLGGARRDRTDDLMLAKHALYQLSYGPLCPRSRPPRGSLQWELFVIRRLSAQGVTRVSVVGPGRLELPTSRLSGVCSNHLSYRPLKRSARRTASRMEAEMRRLRDRAAASQSTACSVYGKRNDDGGDPRIFDVFGEAIGCVSVLEPRP